MRLMIHHVVQETKRPLTWQHDHVVTFPETRSFYCCWYTLSIFEEALVIFLHSNTLFLFSLQIHLIIVVTIFFNSSRCYIISSRSLLVSASWLWRTVYWESSPSWWLLWVVFLWEPSTGSWPPSPLASPPTHASSSHFLSLCTATWPTCQLRCSTSLALWRKFTWEREGNRQYVWAAETNFRSPLGPVFSLVASELC